ncbi:unnamed protein product [Sphagnum jensenii]|uniref:Uncharacterized protein n=1 Tax=Sphagnum jensenii TaxID=128206 RepID=A0ABP0VZY9_9BRYO
MEPEPAVLTLQPSGYPPNIGRLNISGCRETTGKARDLPIAYVKKKEQHNSNFIVEEENEKKAEEAFAVPLEVLIGAKSKELVESSTGEE